MSFINSFNVGTDQSITITAVNPIAGVPAIVTLDGKREMFEMKASDVLVKSEPIDNGGIPDHRVVSDGWAGQIQVEKQSANFSLLASFLDQNFYAGGPQQYFQIIETIRQPGGAGVERNQYVDCVFHGYEPGTWQKKQITKARVSVAAAQRVSL
ncbi:MAG: hypothetical protein KGL39_22005 [Patescibacteria group bacterium]|nr:hypothetical protein [Patescibacteria group bacterium]